MIFNLISSPRNVSTALMYSFAQRTDTKVMDEPFYGYYLKNETVDHPGKASIIATMETDFYSVVASIDTLQEQHEHVFVKNMAHHLYNEPIDFMKKYNNIFFVRHPKELITSFAKVISHPTMQDIGVQQQIKFYKQLKEICTHPPIVVDSSELIKNPSILLTKLCNQLGVPFQKEMLHWQAGGIKEDGIWAGYWYANVHRSTGFVPFSAKEIALPAHCETLYNEALPHYRELAQFSLTVD